MQSYGARFHEPVLYCKVKNFMLEFRSELDSTENSRKGKLDQSTSQDSQNDQDSPKSPMIFFKQRYFCAFLRVVITCNL